MPEKAPAQHPDRHATVNRCRHGAHEEPAVAGDPPKAAPSLHVGRRPGAMVDGSWRSGAELARLGDRGSARLQSHIRSGTGLLVAKRYYAKPQQAITKRPDGY